MTKRLRVGFTYDAKADYILGPGEAPDKYAEFDSEQTLSEIENALRSTGHEILRIGHAKKLLSRLMAGERWDIVFNIAEGVQGRNRESQVPAILEVFDIPCVGSDALTMGITLDKAVAKMVVRHHRVATPAFMEICSPDELRRFSLNYPVFVKPSEEGTSKGISGESVARTYEQMEKRVLWILDRYRQPALVEEFVSGLEFTVAVVGNETPEVLPPVQVAIKGNTDLGDEVYTHERVANDEIHYLGPAPAAPELLDRIRTLAAEAYTALGCRDFGRIDVRVDRSGTPYFIELNPLPSLGRIDVFPLVADASGTTYDKLLGRILEYGCRRYGLL